MNYNKIIYPMFLAFVWLLATEMAYAQNIPGPLQGKMNLLSSYFILKQTGTPKSLLNSSITSTSFSVKEKREGGFSVKFLVNINPVTEQQTILDIPDILTVTIRKADPDKRDRQNYPAFTLKDGSVPVLEATILLNAADEKPFRRELLIGFPLAMLPQPTGKHEIVLNFTGVRWTMYVDNELVDNEFAIGYAQWSVENSWNINPAFVENAAIFFPAINAERDTSKKNLITPDVQYWTPAGHNSWVGDVATIYYKGRFHVFYLYDRRHHASKFGVGGHYFEHFSTRDFKEWTEHEAAVPIEEQWETIGTGTPFVFDNKLCISYGLHTSRIYPDVLTMSPAQIAYFKDHGKTGSFKFDLKNGYPSGATYSVSKNGETDFQKSKILFHYCENPSVYITPDGKLRMIANAKSKGIWESNSVNGGWYPVNKNFPPGGDCTFYFRWGKFDYIIGGFRGLWSKPANAPEDAWRDLVKDGLDFYDGINVPSVTGIGGGRFLMAGWFPIRGWGGPFVIHEMIQFPDGRIGTKWMGEITPATENVRSLAKEMATDSTFSVNDESFMLTFTVNRKRNNGGILGLSFLENEKDGCEFQIGLDSGSAQYANAGKERFASRQPSLKWGGEPNAARDYAIENLIDIDKSFSVRMMVKHTAKLGGAIIDTEIAGKRTMITFRPDLDIKNLRFRTDGIEITDLQLASIR